MFGGESLQQQQPVQANGDDAVVDDFGDNDFYGDNDDDDSMDVDECSRGTALVCSRNFQQQEIYTSCAAC